MIDRVILVSFDHKISVTIHANSRFNLNSLIWMSDIGVDMLMQYFTNEAEKSLTDDYISKCLKKSADCYVKDTDGFDTLKKGDQLVVASANSLTSNMYKSMKKDILLHEIMTLTSEGICLHFVEEECVFNGEKPEEVAKTIIKLIAILENLSDSNPQSTLVHTNKSTK